MDNQDIENRIIDADQENFGNLCNISVLSFVYLWISVQTSNIASEKETKEFPSRSIQFLQFPKLKNRRSPTTLRKGSKYDNSFPPFILIFLLFFIPSVEASPPSPTSSLLSSNSWIVTSLVLATLNIRGISNQSKRISFLDFVLDKQIDVIGITETNLQESRSHPQLFSPFKTIFSHAILKSSLLGQVNNSHKYGVALLLRKEIPVIRSRSGTGPLQGRVLAVELALPLNNGACYSTSIVLVYGPADQQQRKPFYEEFNSFLSNWGDSNLVIMGDFNVNLSNIPPNLSLNKVISDYHLKDCFSFLTDPDPKDHFSWMASSGLSISRIDGIFVSDSYTITSFETSLDNPISSTDHNPIISKKVVKFQEEQPVDLLLFF